MLIVRDLNSVQNRVIAQDYAEQKKYLTDNSVTMRAMLKKYGKVKER